VGDSAIEVLVVEDNPTDARLLEVMLARLTAQGFRWRRVDRLSDALTLLNQRRYDVVLLDLALPDSCGLDTIRRVRSTAADVPIVVLTGLDDESTGLASLREGAQDYLLKDELRPNLLSRALRYAIERQQILDDLCQTSEALQRQESFLRAIVDANPNFIFVKDETGRFVLVNEAIATFYNTTPASMLGKTEVDINPNFKQAEQFQREEQAILETLQEKYIAQEPRRSSDGEVRWFQTIKKPLLLPNSSERHLLGVVTDITERQRAESLLWQQAEREQLLSQVTHQIRRSLDLGQILQTTVQMVRQVLGVDRTAIYRYVELESDGVGSKATLQLIHNNQDRNPRNPHSQARTQPTPMTELLAIDPNEGDQTAVWNAAFKNSACFDRLLHLEDQEVWGIDDLTIDSNFAEPDRQAALQLGVLALLATPILHGEAIPKTTLSVDASLAGVMVDRRAGDHHQWGFLVISQQDRPRQWQPWEREFLQQLSGQLAIAIQQAELYRRLEMANRKLERLATLDGLTGISNRRSFDEALAREWQRALRQQSSLAILVGDIDSFKTYNDRYGHLAGDDCLRQVARAIAQTAKRSSDLAFRYGGEEFAVIAPETHLDGAMIVASNILESVRELQIPHAYSPVAPIVTISLGVASIIPRSNTDPSSLVAAADLALFEAKTRGRNRACSTTGTTLA
jgi:diguanylate cyclase (GGDEF)-like protein/PAS domain S-box-containing protein